MADDFAEFLSRFDPAVDGLWTARIGETFEGAIALDGEGVHPAARHLYECEGFTLVDERLGAQWGKEVLEQRFERRSGSAA